MVNKKPKMIPYLVHINDAWIEVLGRVVKGGKLSWLDKRDGQRGIAEQGNYMRYYNLNGNY